MVIVLGVAITCVLYVVTGLPVTTMVGILSGAVTNTPGLGAAQQAYFDMTGKEGPKSLWAMQWLILWVWWGLSQHSS